MTELHDRALRHSVVIVSTVPAGWWAASTPCADWTLRDLVAHLVAGNDAFASAVTGEPAGPGVLTPGADPAREHAESAERVARALTAPGREAPGAAAHLLDVVVHSWDVAAGLGRTLALEPDLVDAAAQAAARAVPDGAARGSRFAPPLPGHRSDPLDRLLAFLGRDPSFPGGAPGPPG